MQTNQSITTLLKRLWHHISPRRRSQFGLLLVLMVVASFAEIISIGAALPFLGVLAAPERVFKHNAAEPLIQFLGITSPEQLLMPVTISFGIAAFTAGSVRLLLLWTSTRLSNAIGADISINIYRRTLYQPYSVHVSRNSSGVINGIYGKAKVATSVINMTLTIISSFIMLVTILFALLLVEPVLTSAMLGGIGLIYIITIKTTRRRLLINSQRIAKESNQAIKSLQEGLGGIRDVLINRSQEIYCTIYRNADLALRNASAENMFISAAPRYVMDTLGMILIAVLAYTVAQQLDGIDKAIPILGTLAMGTQRLLPILQQAYGAWSTISGAQASLQDALDLLDQKIPDYADQLISKPLSFTQQISLKQLSFSYSQQMPYVLDNINLIIKKGSRIGFIGTTGSGKSTLLDIVMGLLHPSEGLIEVDGQAITAKNQCAWQSHIAHVPQSIYLADATIEENIAFGIPENRIDVDRMRAAAKQAKIADTIEAWPQQYKTVVGERGIRLSGGQRQRIGIARALYKRADVIIFDEATSALDNETEQYVMKAIESLSDTLTVLIIAHRLTTLKNCNQVIQLENGKVKCIGSYREVISVSG